MRTLPAILLAIVLILSTSGCTRTADDSGLQSTTATAEAVTQEAIQQATASTFPGTWDPIDRADCLETPCLFTGHFLLQNPIPSGSNQMPDYTYLFASTQDGLREIHHGVEFGNPSGTPVLAVADGVVVQAGDDALEIFGANQHFYGNLVILSHDLPGMLETVYTLYAHLSVVSVNQGDQVTAGQEIGQVGRSGSALGSHLHFEVRLGENDYFAVVNPELWLVPVDASGGYEAGALAGAILDPLGKPLRVTNIQLQYSHSQAGPVEDQLILGTYYDDKLNSDPVYQENFAFSNLPPGWYRVASIFQGNYISRWVQVESGKLTYLTIQLK